MILYTEKIIPGNYSNISFYTAQEAYYNMGFKIYEVENLLKLNEVEDGHIFLGSIGFMQRALVKLNQQVPVPLDYPESLQKFLGRKIAQSTINEIANHPDQWNVFVKPKGITKKFTGRLVKGTKDLIGCGDFNMDTPVWVSEPVEFMAEWRVFVRYQQIVGVRQYKGDWKASFSPAIIEEAVNAYKDQPAGYALDFGLTKDHQFLLVEANDGYSLGNYGLFYIDYAKLLSARWAQLTHQKDICDF